MEDNKTTNRSMLTGMFKDRESADNAYKYFEKNWRTSKVEEVYS